MQHTEIKLTIHARRSGQGSGAAAGEHRRDLAVAGAVAWRLGGARGGTDVDEPELDSRPGQKWSWA